MKSTDKLASEVLDVVALAASAFVGWWKFVFKVTLGFGAVAMTNGIFVAGTGMEPDVRGYHDGGLLTALSFGAYGLWVVSTVLRVLGRGVRNLFRHGQ